MDSRLLDLLEKSPYMFLIVVLIIAIAILWKTVNKKDAKVYDLADNVIKVASIYERNINIVEKQNREHNEQHAIIIELLKDVKRILK